MVDGIITENAFELAAAVVLDGLVLARVLFYVIAKKRKEFPGRIVLLSGITALQVSVIVSNSRRPLHKAVDKRLHKCATQAVIAANHICHRSGFPLPCNAAA